MNKKVRKKTIKAQLDRIENKLENMKMVFPLVVHEEPVEKSVLLASQVPKNSFTALIDRRIIDSGWPKLSRSQPRLAGSEFDWLIQKPKIRDFYARLEERKK